MQDQKQNWSQKAVSLISDRTLCALASHAAVHAIKEALKNTCYKRARMYVSEKTSEGDGIQSRLCSFLLPNNQAVQSKPVRSDLNIDKKQEQT